MGCEGGYVAFICISLLLFEYLRKAFVIFHFLFCGTNSVYVYTRLFQGLTVSITLCKTLQFADLM